MMRTDKAPGTERLFRPISYLLVFLMLACIILTMGTLVHNVAPNWHAGMIAGILVFIVLDRLYTHRQLASLVPLSSEWTTVLGTQWIVILFFSRFLISYADGPNVLLRDLSLLGRGYLADLFTLEFFVTVMLAIATWQLTAQFLGLLDEIGLDMKFALQERPPHVQSDAVPAHQRMVSLIFTMGIVLVILTVLTRLDVHLAPSDAFPRVEVNRLSGAEAGALLYFVFGLALLSLSRLMSLQTHWNRLRIPVSSEHLPRQWALYSLSFLLILALLVSLLPAGDSFGLFSVMGALVGFLLQVILFVAQLLLGLILLAISLPFLLMGKAPPFLMNAEPPPLPTLPAQTENPITNSAILEFLRSFLLWGLLIAILVYAFVRFVQQHNQIFAAVRRWRLINWLLLAWQWLYRNVEKTSAELRRAVAQSWKEFLSRAEGKQFLSSRGWINVRALDPRRKIYFFYLAMIRRGEEQGLGRDPAHTPAEYATQLQDAVPAAGEDIDVITQAFIEARYSRHEVNAETANLVKATWERIRRLLQIKSKNERSRER